MGRTLVARAVDGRPKIPRNLPARGRRELAVTRRTTVQSLLAEALNDLFAKHGKPEITPRE